MGDFSLALNEDQLQIQKWVHEFAERTIRPAAAEWDEREETPWPIIQEAAKIGLYGWESMAQFFADPTGLRWGSSTRSCSGETPASPWRSSGRASAWPGSWQRHARAGHDLDAPVLRDSRGREAGRLLRDRARTPAPTCRRCAPGRRRTAPTG